MAIIRPKEVDLNPEDYAKLAQFYKTAYIHIAQTLENATDFSRLSRVSILNQVKNIMAQYQVDVTAFIRTELPSQYQKGVDLAAAQLESLGVEASTITTFSQVDQHAIELLVSDSENALGAAISGVTKNVSNLLSDAQKATIKQIIGEGKLTGEARTSIANDIIANFKQQGIGSLTDAGGKTWQLDSYSDMLVRTNAARSRNDAISNTLQQNNQDLVEISDSGSDSNDACPDWEGEVCSLSGDDPDYPALSDAYDDGVFHPNCVHTYSAYTPDLSDRTIQYDSESGDYTDQGGE